MEWASWWNWHLASFMLIFGRAGCPLYSYSVEWASGVELASCQFHAYFRAGRMPTLLLFSGMGIRGGTGILPVSCLFSGGQDAHSTPIHWKIQQRLCSPLAEC
ncbi:MAG: hypothetical protein F6J94_18745 [Moorea sp. SIO1F2]|uniref:hypothetical protein n=1 Tax=Moorena sp. SIO1F2 TaxID=2607819 RepID=UPI0013B9C6C8|nr:hypothetical protein [Moorena sp. SIO1F2]NET83885.1 hypothetical protein [Moorena sp. SIO1F2]